MHDYFKDYMTSMFENGVVPDETGEPNEISVAIIYDDYYENIIGFEVTGKAAVAFAHQLDTVGKT